MSIGSIIFIIAVLVIPIIALVIAAFLPVQKPTASTNPLTPPARNTDRPIKEALRYIGEPVPYRDEL